MGIGAVKQMRVVLVTEDFEAAVAHYRDALGLVESAALAGPDGAQVVILQAGQATLELANEAHGRYIAQVETDGAAGTPVRLAFEVADTIAATAALTAAGAQLLSPAVRTPWNSLNARLEGHAGIQVTLFQELTSGDDLPGDGRNLVGLTTEQLGGEAGLLAKMVDIALQHGQAGQLPFAAAVVRDGVVIGAGVNTAISDCDPSAHGEVTAIRDAGRRTRSAVLNGATVYSSCEPCAICRLMAAASGVREVVFAAPKELVPSAIDPEADATAALIRAVTELLPGIARPGTIGLTTAEMSAPFDAFLATAL